MKKLLLAAAILMTMFAFTGCGDVEGTVFDKDSIKTTLGITDGVDGLSAYEVAVENGFAGTEQEWLDSLRGDAGIDGIDGLDGLSAYQLWVLAGNEGTLEDFFNSLRGEDGQDGVDGQDGKDGKDGKDACPVPEPCMICPPFPQPVVYDGNATMDIHTTAQGWTNIKVGHLLDNGIVEYDDAVETNEDGTLSINKVFDTTASGTHIIGVQFDN